LIFSLKVLESISSKCGIDISANSSPAQTASHTRSPLEKMQVAAFEDIVLYLSDVAFTLKAFLEIYPAAAPLFWETDHFPFRFAAAYEALSMAFTAAFCRRTWADLEQKSYLKKQFRRSQVCLLRVFRLVAYCTCLRPIMAGTSDDDASVSHLVESYLDVMNALLSEKHFLAHLHTLFPFAADIDLMHSSKYLVDEVRLTYIQDACDEAVHKYVKHAARKKNGADAVESRVEGNLAENTGRAYNELGGPTGSEFEGPDVDEVAAACARSVSDVEIESMISSVQDLLPDLGSGFVRLCLEEYNYDTERLINAILEDRLIPSLQNIDRRLAYVPDKAVQMPASVDQQPCVEQRRNIFDGDDFDVFSRNEIDTTRVHKGKRTGPDRTLPQMTPEIRERIAVYAYRPVDIDDPNNPADAEGVFEYDDEYDDTYDSNVIGADDVDSADELLSRRAFVTPRVFADMQGSGRGDGTEDDDESPERPSGAAGAAPPRDAFVEDPAKLRQMREERYAARQQQRQGNRRRGPPPPPQPGASAEAPQGGHDVKGGPRGQGQSADVVRNRAWKEKNKASRVNHNRKDLADRKRRV
jgi:activating signal cointegrator complex subunit 2